MKLQDLDKGTLKAVMTELMFEHPAYFKALIKEILLENRVIVDDAQAERRKRLEQMINEDFDKYDEVFQSLA
jgi:hypothetical protein